MWFLLRQREPFRPCRPLLLRRPKVVFFVAQAEKPRLFFFFSAPPRYGVRRSINFFDPPKNNFGPKKHFRPQFFFSAPPFFFRRSERITQPDTWAPALGPILKGGVGGREGGREGGKGGGGDPLTPPPPPPQRKTA